MASIYEIASQAHVSLATVSRALNPSLCHKVKAETRAKILEICDRNYYRPQASARAFASGKAGHISLILGSALRDLTSPIFAEFITGLSSGLQSRGYGLKIHMMNYDRPDWDQSLHDYILSGQADGFILGSSLLSSSNAELLSRLHLPVLSLSHHLETHYPSLTRISWDDRSAIRALLQILPQSWSGCSLFTGTADRHGVNNFKWNQVKQVLSELSLPENFFQFQLFPCPCTGFHIDRYNGMRFAEENYESLSRFRFIWCTSDLNALGICDAMKRRGRIPGRDFYIAGFDNIERIMNDHAPLLSTIDYCGHEQGCTTARYILQAVRTGKFPPDLTISSSVFITRNSLDSKYFPQPE